MTQPVSSVTAVLPKDTVYTVNDSDVKVVDGRPSLLVDEIVSTDNSASGSDYPGVSGYNMSFNEQKEMVKGIYLFEIQDGQFVRVK